MTGLLGRGHQLRLAQGLVGIAMAQHVSRDRLAHAGTAALAELAGQSLEPLLQLGVEPHTDRHDPGVQQSVEHPGASIR